MNPIAPCTWCARGEDAGDDVARVGVGQRHRAHGAGGVGIVAVESPRGLVREHAHGVALDPDVDALVRDGLVHADGSAELLAVGGVIDGEGQRGVAQPDRVRGVEHAEVGERARHDRRAAAPRSPTTSSGATATSVNVTAAIGSGENVSCGRALDAGRVGGDRDQRRRGHRRGRR